MTTPAAEWAALADTLLQREALVCRMAEGRPPRDFAGLYVGEEDLDRILGSLPGLDGPAPDRVAAVHAGLAAPVRDARQRFAGTSRFAAVVRSARLGVADAEVLALLAAVEQSPARQRLVAYLQDSVQLPRLTLATLARVFADAGHPAERTLAPDAPMRRAALVDLAGTGPWSTLAGAPAARLIWHLRDDSSLDPDLPPGTIRRLRDAEAPAGRRPGDAEVPASRRPGEAEAAGGRRPGDAEVPGGRRPGDAEVPGGRRPGEAEAAAGRRPGYSDAPADRLGGLEGLLLVNGGDRESRYRAVDTYRPGAGQLVCPPPATPAGWAAVVREATLGDLVVVLDLDGPLSDAGRESILRADHLVWVLSSRGELPLESIPDTPWTEIHLDAGDADADDWRTLLGRPPDPAYPLSRDQLRLVAMAAAADGGDLAPAVRRLAGGHLDGVAVRVRPRRGWGDLVVPPDEGRQLRELAARHRGRETVYGRWGFSAVPSAGVVALFAGPSGTGKTLAAEVVAGELGLDLYKVDLSAVVSKYIGETEKNLERIFSAAAAGDLVLFFDEADALFGKRSEVSDAHDRYANIEVAYLLQRLETYDGMVILATNLQRNIDPAFLRRISVAVDFVAPEEPQRRSIWAHAFPSTAPLADLDLDFLARQFKITGGVISNAALGAAFLAAAEDAPITMRHVVLSLKREFQKLGRLRTEKEFERYFDLVNRDADVASAR